MIATNPVSAPDDASTTATRSSASPVDCLDPALLKHVSPLLALAPEVAQDSPFLAVAAAGHAPECVLLAELERWGDLTDTINALNQAIVRRDAPVRLRIRDDRPSTWTFDQLLEGAARCGLIPREVTSRAAGLSLWKDVVHAATLKSLFPHGIPTPVADEALKVSSEIMAAIHRRPPPPQEPYRS